MFTSYVTLTLAAVSAVSATVIPRTASSSAAGPIPSTYTQQWLEPYGPYHARYEALDCAHKHNTQFFDDCCHPLLKWETLATARKPYCIPGAASSVVSHAASSTVSLAASKTTSAVAATSTSDECYEDDDDCECVDDDGGDDECEEGDDDCECEEEGESSSIHPTSTSSHSAEPTSTQSRSVVIVTSYSTASDATATSTVVPSSTDSSVKSTATSSSVKSTATSSSVKASTATSSSVKATTAPSSSAAPTTVASSKAQTTSAAPQTTETPSSTVKPTSSATVAVALTKQTTGTFSGGVATFFWQGGVAGACGKVNPDSALIAAIDAQRYGNLGDISLLCGKQVQVTNESNGKSVLVTIADACPTCKNSNSIDLSYGAFTEIATEEEGEVNVTIKFV